MSQAPDDFRPAISRADLVIVEMHSDGYLRRGDFSRWVADVFGDAALAAELRELEGVHRASPTADTGRAVVRAILDRYELSPASLETAIKADRTAALEPAGALARM